MKRLLAIALTAGIFFDQAVPSLAADEDAFQFFQEEAKVVTASRREQSVDQVPAAVDVITADEIKASGAVNLWDLLRFRPGMDVMDTRAVDGNRAIVSIRGFPQEFVHNIQVLVDGRSVYEPIGSTTEWDQLPVQMQDIERIEIIRGPNAALYGSGAGLGVINIITRKPQEGPTTAVLQSEGGNRGMVQTSGSLDSSAKDFAYRASYTFRQFDGFSSSDFFNSNKANVRTRWTPREGSSLELFAGGSWNRQELPSVPVSGDTFDQDFQMAKFSQKLGNHSSMEVLSSRSDSLDRINFSRVLQYDEQILQRFDLWNNRINTTYGVNYRGLFAYSGFLFGTNAEQEETLWNGYVNQSLQISRQFALTGGVSWDHSNIGSGGVEPNYQLGSVWSPVQNNSFRASYAVSHAVPGLFQTAANNSPSPNVLLVGDPNLAPEKLTSYEIGHRASLMDGHFQVDSSLYYVIAQDLNNSTPPSISFSPALLVTQGFGNVNQAIARGFETEIKYAFTHANSIYANYTYEHVTDQAADSGDVTKNTPAHKANFGGIAQLGKGFSGSVNVGYKDNYFIDSDGLRTSAFIPAYWRLDARIAYAVNPRVDLFIAGQNLAVSTHEEFPDGLVVPRTYQGGVSLKFGGKE